MLIELVSSVGQEVSASAIVANEATSWLLMAMAGVATFWGAHRMGRLPVTDATREAIRRSTRVLAMDAAARPARGGRAPLVPRS